MSSSRAVENDSLGLLLDTICNSFGAVVFLSLLIAIMVMQSPNLHKGAYDRRRAELQLELDRADRELDDLKEQASQQQEFLSRLQAEVPELVDEVRDLTNRENTLRAARDKLGQRIASQKKAVSEATSRVDSMRAAVRSAKQRRSKASIAVDRELKTRAATVRASRVRPTSKSEVIVLLRYDRLYVWHQYSAAGNRLGLNTDEFVVLADNGVYLETAPRPGTGTPLRARGADEALRRRLKQFDARLNYLAIIVWPDSFDSFQVLKTQCVENGFEYRLAPASNPFVDRGGRGGSVQ